MTASSMGGGGGGSGGDSVKATGVAVPASGGGTKAPLLKAKPASSTASASSKEPGPEERILVSEVEVVGAEGELKSIAQAALKIRPNFAYTSEEVAADVRRIFNTGWFAEVVPSAVDTRDGVRLVMTLKPNAEVHGMRFTGADALPNKVVQKAFAPLFGKTLNFVSFKEAIGKVDQWYAETGVVGQVADFSFVDGVVQVQCAEASVGEINLRFIDGKTQTTSEKPKTRPEVVLRHLTTKPGKVYNLNQAKRDIASIYSMGIFEDVNFSPKEAESSTEVHPIINLEVNLVEKKTGGLGAGGGLSAQGSSEGGMPGFVGSFTYSERNLFGLNQKLTAQAEIGQIEKMFRVVYTDPWISWPKVSGDKHRTSRTLSLMNNRSSGAITHGRAETDQGASSSGSAAFMLGRLTGGIEIQRPLSTTWATTVGLHCQRTTCSSEHGEKLTRDCYGAPLTFSGRPDDEMLLASASASHSHPDGTSQLLFSFEQSIPARRDWLCFTRLRARADKQIPLLGSRLVLSLRARGGHVKGDLPPYEAFPIGGTNSVRGYAEGGLGSGRSWVEGTAELRFPIMAALSGCLFLDSGSDLDSGATVVGDPAGTRNKPGRGFGFGAGVRMDSPVGPLRLEYAWNDKKIARFHVGVGNE